MATKTFKKLSFYDKQLGTFQFLFEKAEYIVPFSSHKRNFFYIDMNRTINLFLISMIIVLCYAQSINSANCMCSCCAAQFCTQDYQGSFSLDACLESNCAAQCRVKYTKCPPEGQFGITNGTCVSSSTYYNYAYNSVQSKGTFGYHIFFLLFAGLFK